MDMKRQVKKCMIDFERAIMNSFSEAVNEKKNLQIIYLI